MWDNIVASALVIGVVIVVYGLIHMKLQVTHRKEAQTYYKQMQKRIKESEWVVLMGGIKGQIVKIEDAEIHVRIAENTVIHCLRESVQRVL